jgi:hypothetical protein
MVDPFYFASELTTYDRRYAPFTYDAWKHPKTLEKISRIAGVDLVPAIDLEISNINIATQGFSDGEIKASNSNDLPATKWHYDSYPFVCVVMLSDTTHMVGGETAIRKPSGEVVRIRGPQRVWHLQFPYPSSSNSKLGPCRRHAR